jgi:hypothetical protein
MSVSAPEVDVFFCVANVNWDGEGAPDVDVHIGTSPDFVPSSDTYAGTLYSAGTFAVPALRPSRVCYARLTTDDGGVSPPSQPVVYSPLVNTMNQGK